MGRSLGGLLLKGVGLLVVAMVVLAVIGTIVGIVFGIIAAVVSLLVTLAVLAVLVLAGVGLFSLFAGGDDDATEEPWATERYGRDVDDRDLETRLRDRYVAGEIDEAEYERKLELLLGSSDADDTFGRSERDSNRSVLDRLRD